MNHEALAAFQVGQQVVQALEQVLAARLGGLAQYLGVGEDEVGGEDENGGGGHGIGGGAAHALRAALGIEAVVAAHDGDDEPEEGGLDEPRGDIIEMQKIRRGLELVPVSVLAG